MTTIIDGSAGITFPSGSNPQAAPSKVLQVVQATYSTQTIIASTTYTDIGLSASITPLFSTSKILIFASVLADVQRSSYAGGGGISIVRNSTTVWAPNPNGSSQPYTWYVQISNNATGGMEFTQMMNLNYLDSPATTSATTYKIQGATYSTANSGQMNFQIGNSGSNIILMEIAA